MKKTPVALSVDVVGHVYEAVWSEWYTGREIWRSTLKPYKGVIADANAWMTANSDRYTVVDTE